MRKTKSFNTPIEEKILVTDEELQSFLGVGRKTAVEISIAADARIQFGRLKRNNINKIRCYINGK